MPLKHLLVLLQLTSAAAWAQPAPSLVLFREHSQENAKSKNTSTASNTMFTGGTSVNYLAPLAYAYANKQGPADPASRNGYYDNLSQTLAFTGDFKAVLECIRTTHHPVDTGMLSFMQERIKGFHGAQLKDAKDFILQSAASRQVVMINEAHCKPVHRAFTYSLLSGLYQEGFRYLAMETLNNHEPRTVNKLTVNTGYYTCEPVAGELVRKALSLGFTLVPYEDTAMNSSPRQRDSAQAMHLFGIIQKDPGAKILVHAGYGHIEKQKITDEFSPMAFQFRNISGIDPFCIDQTTMSEEGDVGSPAAYYDLLTASYPAKEVSVLLQHGKAVKYYTEEDSYDVRIIHPRSSYTGGRATWYSLGKERTPVLVPKAPPKTFLVQAYYSSEWKQDGASAIPADQTYLETRKAAYTLFLRKGLYHLVFRDMDYNMVGTKTLQVN